MQVCKNVWQVGGSGSPRPKMPRFYLIRFGDAAALIDAGCGEGVQSSAPIGPGHSNRWP
jgi:hypothetical protein